MTSRDHPVFSAFYRLLAAAGERTWLGRTRRSVLAEASGVAVIVGLGPGHDLDHLPPAVREVIAIEPSAPMRSAASPRVEAARRRGIDVRVIDAVAESLPIPDSSVDTVVFALVLCSVDSPALALAEARRVLRPGGRVAVIEHVAAEPGTRGERIQRHMVRGGVWDRLSAGCNPRLDTLSEMSAAGFDVSGIRRHALKGANAVAPVITGVAQR